MTTEFISSQTKWFNTDSQQFLQRQEFHLFSFIPCTVKIDFYCYPNCPKLKAPAHN